MIPVEVTQNGEPNKKGDTWSYNVSYSGQRAGDAYTARARHFEIHYLLEEKYGSASQEPFRLFGIEDIANYETADTRLYNKARARATEVMDSLIPRFEDKTSHSVKNKGGRQ
jgi:hypothetical protein